MILVPHFVYRGIKFPETPKVKKYKYEDVSLDDGNKGRLLILYNIFEHLERNREKEQVHY